MTPWRAFRELFRKYFLAGLVVVIPLMGTIWILKVLVYAVEDFFFAFVPAPLLPEKLIGMRIPGVGLILTILLLLVVGILTRLVLARQLLKLGEHLLARIPIGRGVYQGLKQLMSLFVGNAQPRYTRVVRVDLFQPGLSVYGFVTSTYRPPDGGTELLYVFVPTTPNPTTGFLFLVPKERTQPAGISVDEAMKLILTGGLMARTQDI
ncbi:MAG: DUF502 domain-containing protein [Deltaproteobacteria bacterium]|nr:DUF502 domain-containing protein [Deltaproteobacteria bacterium]